MAKNLVFRVLYKTEWLQLSIIIVNYNVKYFLEQCLSSVYKAINGINAEVFVVDNASSDGSYEYLQPRFSWVKYLANNKNVGFAKANNQALLQCSGDYVLFLNPDTVVEEDCFKKCLAFFVSTPNAGALGIRMVDGQGIFLPESKRSFPSPVISFFKLIGLNSLFPRSRFFSKYTLGYLDQLENHEVDVLAGAFLMARKNLLLQLNGFDETFFMYGEDIDLSYRIQQAGFKNYYFSGSTIIHFKGESTKKGSLNYVRMFYQAMSIFVRKHYGGSRATLFRYFIQIAIWIRAALSAFKGIILKIGLPVLDAAIIFGSFELVNSLWISYFREGHGFNKGLVNIALPGFTLVFLFSAMFAGIYDKKYKPSKAFYAGLVATIVMLATYSLLPEKFRFSRAVILFGGLVAMILIVLFRWLLLKWRVVEDDDELNKNKQTLVAGTSNEYLQVEQLLKDAGLQNRILGRVAVNGSKQDSIGTIYELSTLTQSLRLREIIFCEGYLSYAAIIDEIQKLPKGINVRFHSKGTHSIVGSDSKDNSGEFVAVDGSFELNQQYQRRQKRMVDLAVAFFLILTFPIHLLLCGGRIIYNAVLVIAGKRTWIGYAHTSDKLPKLRRGVLATNGFPVEVSPPLNKESVSKIDEWYARNYDWLQDVKLVTKHYRRLGGSKLGGRSQKSEVGS